MDQRITNTLEKILKSLMEKKELKLGNSIPLLGSMSEGSFSAGFFEAVISGVPTIDIDFAFKGKDASINKKHRHFIIESQKPGFVYLKLEKEIDKEYFRGVLLNYDDDDVVDQIVGECNDFIKTNQLKEILRRSNAFEPIDYETALSFLFNIPRRRIVVKQVRRVTKSSTDQTNEVYLDGVLKAIIHVDFPILMQLDWPCLYVKLWKKRQRKWPDLDSLSKVLKISFLIAKTSREEKSNINATELQYSFAHIEQKIMRLLSTNQRTLFYTAKVIFKKWIQPLSEVYFPSFLVKNTMFWICEQTPPDDPLWDFISDEEFFTSLRYFFIKLTGYFMNGFMPYYFIPDVNLIEGLPDELFEKVLATLKYLSVVKDKRFLPDNKSRDLAEGWMDSMELFLHEFDDFLEIATISSVYASINNNHQNS